MLHIEDDPSREGKKKVSKDLTYAAPSKQTEEVLLMTCRVKVMAPDGSVLQARALFGNVASTSLITKCLDKK